MEYYFQLGFSQMKLYFVEEEEKLSYLVQCIIWLGVSSIKILKQNDFFSSSAKQWNNSNNYISLKNQSQKIMQPINSLKNRK